MIGLTSIKDVSVMLNQKLLQMLEVDRVVLSSATIILKNYSEQVGGFYNKSLKRGAYAIYSNGVVISTQRIFFFNNYPSIEPGAELFIPQKEEKRPLSAGEIVGISSGLGSLAVIILNLVK